MQTGVAQFHRDRLTWLSYVMLVCCGYVQGSLGPAASMLRTELRFDYTIVSLHMSAFAGGMLVAGALARRLAGVVHRRGLLWIGGAGLATGTAALTLSRYPLESAFTALLTGLMSCWAVVAVQAALSDRHGPQRATALTEANLGGSIGSIVAMSCLAALTAAGMPWRVGLLVPLLAIGAVGLAYHGEPIGTQSGDYIPAIDRASMPRRFWAFWATLLLAVGIEWSVTFWAVPYLKDVLDLSAAAATMATGGLFTAIVIGRVLGSRWTRRQRVDQLLPKALLLTLGGAVLLLRGPVPLALVGLLITGLGIANLYPLALSLVMNSGFRYGDLVSARCTAAVGLALMVFPLIVGRLADILSIRTALTWIVLVLIGLAMAAREPRVWLLLTRVEQVCTNRRLRRADQVESSSSDTGGIDAGSTK